MPVLFMHNSFHSYCLELEKLTASQSSGDKSKEPFEALKNALNSKLKSAESQDTQNKKQKKKDIRVELVSKLLSK